VVLPVSSLLTGQLGLSGLYLSRPCLVGAGGVEQVLVPQLDAIETAASLGSASVLREAIAGLAIA
jgi:L-lactate dehydrogenase